MVCCREVDTIEQKNALIAYTQRETPIQDATALTTRVTQFITKVVTISYNNYLFRNINIFDSIKRTNCTIN